MLADALVLIVGLLGLVLFGTGFAGMFGADLRHPRQARDAEVCAKLFVTGILLMLVAFGLVLWLK